MVIAANAAAQAPPMYWVSFENGWVKAESSNNWAASPTIHTSAIAPTGANQFYGVATAEKLDYLPYVFGGKSTVRQYVYVANSYPHYYVPDVTNLQTFALDDLTGATWGSSKTTTNNNFICEEYSYIQFSKVFYGYLDTLGLGTYNEWKRVVKLDSAAVLDRSGIWGSEFQYNFYSPRFLISPGAHNVQSSLELYSDGESWPLLTPGRNWHMHETYQNVGNFFLPESAWWVYPVPSDTVHPNSYQVVSGKQVGGSLASLGSSDDNSLRIQGPTFTRKDPSIAVVVSANLPNLPDLALRAYVEASAMGTGVNQTISLWNFQTSRFDVLDKRTATGTDSFALGRTEQLAIYVHPVTRQVVCELRWIPLGNISNRFSCSIDEVRIMACRQ
jgi:hypothetical protein